MAPKALSPKQKEFVKQYVLDHNGAQAAIRAGYAANSARVSASRLLTNDNVIEAINEIENDANIRHEINLDRVIQKLGSIAYDDDQDTGHQLIALKELRKHIVMQGDFLLSFRQEADAADKDDEENVRVVLYLPDNGRGPKTVDGNVIKKITSPG